MESLPLVYSSREKWLLVLAPLALTSAIILLAHVLFDLRTDLLSLAAFARAVPIK
jgi:hypothetical protein